MPEFVFAGPYPVVYTEGRDTQGANLGEMKPGQIRDLDQAPDQWWHETTDEDRARLAAAQADEAAAEADAALTADEAAADGGGAGSGPVPPSTIPQPVPGA